ncbi:alpha/beta hydrolase [Verticiella sediminum]|uniref:Alpha/beta hydrolase n=1 Tax=Verticiella sediminum TaxID=1247510 RepID=A0A556A905_9BURK|nr:alpha/beta hydrolase [Verticiella sediminum]TSH89360.1 alpha/beta hydrolase [Verticiella sediminum]
MKRLFDHHAGEHLDVDGACLYCEEAGDPQGQALVLLHGGFGTMEDFNGLLAAVAGDFHVHAIDFRGHGRSTLGYDRLCYARLAQDVAQFIAYRGLRNPAMVGINDGGVIAYRLAAEADLGIARAVAIGASWDISHRAASRQELATITGASWRTRHPDAYHAYQRLNPHPDFDGLAEVVVGMWLDDTPAGYPGPAVERIACPLLVVRGDSDRYMPRHAAVDLVDRVSGAQLLNIPSAGAAVLEDAAEIAVSCIKRFLVAA